MNLPDVSELTLAEKVGQMLCLGWRGAARGDCGEDCLLNVNDQAVACVRDLKAGGLIVMGRNVQAQTTPVPPLDVPRVRAMLDELQRLAAVPLLVATDQEGGRVARLRGAPFTSFPAATKLQM